MKIQVIQQDAIQAEVPALIINLNSVHTIKGLLRESIDKSDAIKCADSCLLSSSDHVWEFVDHSDSVTRGHYSGTSPAMGDTAGGLYVYRYSDRNFPCVDANETNWSTGWFLCRSDDRIDWCDHCYNRNYNWDH